MKAQKPIFLEEDVIDMNIGAYIGIIGSLLFSFDWHIIWLYPCLMLIWYYLIYQIKFILYERKMRK